MVRSYWGRYPTLQRSVVAVALATCLVSPANGQDSAATDKLAAPSKVEELSFDAVQTRLTALQENPEVDAALKTRLTEIYQKTLEALKAAGEAKSRDARFSQQMSEAPQARQSLQMELSVPAEKLKVEFPADATLTQAQQKLTQAEADLADAQKVLQQWQDEPKRRTDRRIEIPKLVDANKQQLDEVDRLLNSKPSPEESDRERTANRLLLEARKAGVLAESAALQAELRFYETAADNLPLRRDLAARQVAQLDEFVKRLRDDINERRRQETERQAREARRVAAQAHPALRAIADRNAELAKLRQDLAGKIEAAENSLDRTDGRVDLLDNQFAKLSKRVEMGQRNNSIGLLLRKQREELPNVSQLRNQLADRAELIADTSLQLIDFEDEGNELTDIDSQVNKLLDDLDGSLVPEEQSLLEGDIREMLQTQRNYLNAIIADTNNYLDKLVEQDIREQELIAKALKFAQYIDERILWIRSARPFDAQEVGSLTAALQRLIDFHRWQSLGQALWTGVSSRPWLTGVVFLLWLTLAGTHHRLRTLLMDLGEQAAKGSCRNFSITLRALVLTLALACPAAGLCALIGWLLSFTTRPPEFADSVGIALLQTSLLLGAFEFLRQTCRRRGLAEAHFNWDAYSLRKIRHGVNWLLLIGLPLALVVLTTEAQTGEDVKNSVGRMAFVILHAILLIPCWYIAEPSDGVLAPAYRRDPTAWWTRLCWLWLAVALATPATLIGLAVTGYYYTAVQLSARMLMTGWLIVGLIVVYGLLLRWALIAYRNLGMQRLQERRASAAAAANAPMSATPAPAVANTQLEIKLADINQQTRWTLQLVLAAGLVGGVWWIWVTVVPALGALRHIELWTLEAPTGSGGEVKLIPITLADLMLSAIVLTLTVGLTRSLPSLLELTILKRLPLDAGARFAVSTVAKYIVFGVGAAVGLSQLGVEWSQVQWLVAALGVGLGFGLQEIFANFVSGLVLLFERPIRIGDIVTVGDVTGKVSSIRMRAATITDWDMRELIVPNKEFITGRVINWTLSTTVSRMSINCGVAYGTDPDLVKNLLLEVAAKHPLVLKDPPSHALLDEFADSTLTFVLRVHMPTRDVYLQLRHELMSQIAARFHEANIEFAFPQRDINVRHVEAPFDVSMQVKEHSSNGGQRKSPLRETFAETAQGEG